MPCGCFGKKKKAAEEEEKYRQRDSKSREREPPSPTPVPAPAPTVVPAAAPTPAAPTPEGDARLRPEDDPDKTSRRRDVVASFYNDQCELIGFKATGSRPPSAYVGGAHHDGSASVSSSGSPGSMRPGASCRADLAEKRREFFKQLTIESEDGSRPGTRPNSRTTNSLTRTRDSNHEEQMSVIQMAKSSLRPVKPSPQSADSHVPFRPNLSEEEARGMQYRVARELMLKDIRQQAFTLRPSTEKVNFKNMLPEEKSEESNLMSNGEADATPLLREIKQREPSEKAPPNKVEEKSDTQHVQRHTETKVDLSVIKTSGKRSEQIDPEISDLLENLSGQEISDLLVDLSESEMDLPPEDSAKSQCPQSQQANSSNQVIGNLATDVYISGSESGMQKSTGQLPDNFQVCTGNGDIPALPSQPISSFTIETSPAEVSVTEVKQESVELPSTKSTSLIEVEGDLQLPSAENISVLKVTQETVLLPASEPKLVVEVKQESVELPAVQPPCTDEVKHEPFNMPTTEPIPLVEVKQEVVQLPQENPPMLIEEIPQETTVSFSETVHEFPQERVADEMHIQRHEDMTEIVYLSSKDQNSEGIGDPSNTLLPASVDPSFLRTEEEPDELLLQQSLHQPPALPAEESAPLLSEPVVDPLPNVAASQPTVTEHSPDEHESLPPAPPTPPSGSEPSPPTQLSSPHEGNEQTHQVPVTQSTVEEPLLILDEPLPPAPPTPPLEREPLPPAPPTPPMSSSPPKSPVTCATDAAAAPVGGSDGSGRATEGGQLPSERLGEDCNTERAAASS